MNQKVKRLSQTFFVLILVTIVSLLSMVFINTYSDSIIVTAQENSFDLKVTKTANVSSIASGGTVTFTILIENQGPDPALFVTFFDDYPAQMQNVQYMFSTAVISTESETPGKPYWLFNEIASGQTIVATVTGQLVSASYATAINEATVSALGELTPADNTDDASVTISSGGTASTVLYLPIINKAPPRSLIVSDNFSSSSSGWTSADDSNCERGYSNSQYRMRADNDEVCFTPAPPRINNINIEYTYAEYQVSAYVSSGDGNFDYGIYMNGAGGDNYYLFRIKPDDNCGWRLVRRQNGTNTTLGSGNCTGSGINTGTGWNTFAIRHDRDGLISVFVNDQTNNNENPLFTINDANRLTGRGTGLFVEADDNEDITARFDNFQVYTVAQ